MRYTATAKWLHWLVAALIVANLALGLWMVGLPGITPTKLRAFNWHKWVGVTVFVLASVRLLWRLGHAPPPLPASMRGWERRAAQTSHALLYALLFALPLSGYFYSLSTGYPIVWFGIIPLPVVIGPDPALKPVLVAVHHLLAWAMLAIVAVHAAAALKHHLVDRDDVLRRMLPQRR